VLEDSHGEEASREDLSLAYGGDARLTSGEIPEGRRKKSLKETQSATKNQVKKTTSGSNSAQRRRSLKKRVRVIEKENISNYQLQPREDVWWDNGFRKGEA